MSENLLCPYCGADNTPEDVPTSFNPHEAECDQCGKEFTYSIDWNPDYFASKTP